MPHNANPLNYDKWNRNIMNLFWICNIIILIAELAIAVIFQKSASAPELSYYLFNFVFMPSSLILLLTAGCELAVRFLGRRKRHLQPYVVTFTCVAHCAVLLVIHYSVTMMFAIYILPLFFSLVYNSKRILSYTFLSSFSVFIAVYVLYFSRFDLPYASVTIVDGPVNIAILITSYLISLAVLNRFGDILTTLTAAEHSAMEAEMAKKRAEAVAEARTRFLANMSHEIRTPMNGIIGLSELALDNEAISEIQKEYLLAIRNSADGLLAIINNILDISKIDAGEASLEHIPFDLHTVLGDCEMLVKHNAAAKKLRLYCYDESRLEYKIMGDPTKLRQALLNFLSNAVKFTRTGSVTLIAKADPLPAGSGKIRIFFEISDTGIGMTKEQCRNIFEPFHQADNSITRSYGGTGLGLAITKNIIELMGGEITVRSIPDIGSRFSFFLEFDLSDEPVSTESADGPTVSRPFFDGDVLLCEDDIINQQVAVQNLDKLGLRVMVATNGRTGIEAVFNREQQNKPFDIIFMDINMPVMDGVSAAKALVAAGVKTPIIAMTAVTMTDDHETYIEAGMADCLCKPFKAQELWACLLKYMAPVKMIEEIAHPAHTPLVQRGEKPALDEAAGVESFSGNEQAYLQALDIFVKKYSDSDISALLEQAIEAGDFELAKSTAHTEKGSALIIGAVRLSESLMILEESLRGNGKYYNSDMLRQYKGEHEKVLQRITEMRTQTGPVLFDAKHSQLI